MKTRERFPSFHFHSNFHVFISQYFCVLLLFFPATLSSLCRYRSRQSFSYFSHSQITFTPEYTSRKWKKRDMKNWEKWLQFILLFMHSEIKMKLINLSHRKALKLWKLKAHECQCRLDHSQLSYTFWAVKGTQISVLFVNYDTFLVLESLSLNAAIDDITWRNVWVRILDMAQSQQRQQWNSNKGCVDCDLVGILILLFFLREMSYCDSLSK